LAGNIARLDDYTANQAHSFSYDARNRLTAAAVPGASPYSPGIRRR
jgi:hypothetical protein